MARSWACPSFGSSLRSGSPGVHIVQWYPGLVYTLLHRVAYGYGPTWLGITWACHCLGLSLVSICIITMASNWFGRSYGSSHMVRDTWGLHCPVVFWFSTCTAAQCEYMVRDPYGPPPPRACYCPGLFLVGMCVVFIVNG